MNAYERRLACPSNHARPVNGTWRLGDNERPEKLTCSNGVIQWKAVCRDCNTTSSALPQRFAAEWLANYDGAPTTRVKPAVEHDPCCVIGCDSTDTEYHHFAPWNTFGAEANDWPVLPVCKPHHREWHSRMDGYRWHKPRTAA